MKRLQYLPRGQRLFIFVLIFGGGLMLLVALVILLILSSINSAERRSGQAIAEGVTVTEYATLPDDDAYPATVAASPDGLVYTASYASGRVWRIDPDGVAVPVPGSLEQLGAVTALAFGPDGTLVIIDRLTSDFRSTGGAIWTLSPAGDLDTFGDLDAVDALQEPQDVAVDADGNIYVLDRSRRQIWRFDTAGDAVLWWEVPPDDLQAADTLPNGLAYDSATNTFLVAGTEPDILYRVAADGESSEVIYRHETGQVPGFDGLDITSDGTIYAAANALNAVVRVESGAELVVIADNFRGVSDIAYHDGRLYASNFDSRALVLPGVNPQLPFGLDVITFE